MAPGTLIGGRYRLERKLGKGGVGHVWAGVRVEDGAKVAVKLLLPAAAAHPELVARFRREADFLKRIRSKYVSRVLDFLSDQTQGLALVLELVEGESLSEVLARTPLTIEEAFDVCWDVIGGIADLHRAQIIHRDLKPGNVIVQKTASGRTHAVIVDFGMSRFTGKDQDGEEITALTKADIAVGTMEYMAPEQILNSRGVTGAADIYALGAMLYRAVTGRHIFGELAGAELARYKMVTDPPPLVIERSDPLAQGFARMIDKMIQRVPKDRYERAEEVFAVLAALRAPPSSAFTSSPSVPTVEPPGLSSRPAASLRSSAVDVRPEPRSKAGLVLAIFAGLVVVGGIGVLAWQRYGPRAAAAPEQPGVEAMSAESDPRPAASAIISPSASVSVSPTAASDAPAASASSRPVRRE